MQAKRNSVYALSLVALVLAFAAGFAATRAFGPLDRQAEGDGPEYMSIAQSLTHGGGYVMTYSPWPKSPDVVRVPEWPLTLAAVSLIFRHANQWIVLRICTIACHALAAGLLVLLTFRIRPDLVAAALAGILFALYPSALILLDPGYAEPIWVATVTLGLLMVFGERLRPLGAFLLGLAVLSRPNFILFPALLAISVLICNRSLLRYWRQFAFLTVIFLIPTGVWVLRNYIVSKSLLLSAVEGETFYGGNNSVVASELDMWGYWTFPDYIPGETPKHVLGQRMTAVQLDRYYMDRGKAFLRANWILYPRLVLGRLIRSFWPVPWMPKLDVYAAAVPRMMLYAAFLLVLVFRKWLDQRLAIVTLAIFLGVLMTTLVFCGSSRYSFCVEPFLIVQVAIAVTGWWREKRLPAYRINGF